MRGNLRNYPPEINPALALANIPDPPSPRAIIDDAVNQANADLAGHLKVAQLDIRAVADKWQRFVIGFSTILASMPTATPVPPPQESRSK